MALASCPAFQGQQRSLRRMCQVFSWALARSPGERSWACARLASFCEAGLFRPRYMRGVYSHISRVAPRSAVAVLDGLLAPYRDTRSKIGSRFAPRIGHPAERNQGSDHSRAF